MGGEDGAPEKFFERTYLPQNLVSMAAEVVRRLSGEKTESSAVFNLNTQFGGGKTTPSPSSLTSPKTAPRPRAGPA